MFRQGLLGIAPAAAFAAWASCGVPQPAMALGVAADAPPSSLIVLPGALNVHRSSRDGASLIRYRLEAEFPAAGPIVDVVKRLRRSGWIPLEDRSASAWRPSSLGGWTSFVDASAATRVRVYNWWSEWTNLGGDHVSYAFEYQAPEHGAAALRSLSVAAGFYPAPLVRTLKEEAARAADEFAWTHPAEAAAEREEPRRRTMLPARDGDAFLLSGTAGQGVLRITSRSGEQVAYDWRFRTPDGSESSDSVPEASMVAVGPYRLLWIPRSPLGSTAEKEAALGYFTGVDLIPIPGEHFRSLDLNRIHALTTLLPERDRAFAAASLPAEAEVRRDAMIEAGKTRTIDSGRALLVQGPKGSAVIEIVEPGLKKVTYRWRYRPSAGAAEASGEAEASEQPYPELRVGPYSMEWQVQSMSGAADPTGHAAWSGDVKYLPEEFSVATIPAGDATRVDLAAVSVSRVRR